MAPRKGKRGWWGRRGWQLVLLVAPALISGALRLLALTVRMRLVNMEELWRRWQGGEQVILAFWHNRVVMMPLQYRGRKICIMNSQHRDGEIASRALHRWGIHTVGGSATRGGVGGFLRLLDAFRQGYDLAVVPDGPRGPRYQVKPGILHLARATGADVFPISYAAAWKRQLHSWDRLIIPLPFSRIAYVAGEPLRVPRDASDERLEELRLELESRLNQATTDAEALIG